jgi:hypothetical protein
MLHYGTLMKAPKGGNSLKTYHLLALGMGHTKQELLEEMDIIMLIIEFHHIASEHIKER